MNKKVILAFSGGIDSSAVAEILCAEGYEITALMLSLIEGDEEQIIRGRAKATGLGAEFVVRDCREQFRKEIIDHFVGEYIAGRTPAPCTRCNPFIKWRELVAYAKSVGADHIATGHYFSKTTHNGKIYVSKAKDPRKDQSYYLWGLNQETLSMVLTPMADKIKDDIKSRSTLKKESMGVCFLQGGHYSELIERGGYKIRRGEVVTSQGEVVGEHRGLAFYTIGQKRGEGIPRGMAVIAIDAIKNQITVGDDHELYTSQLVIENCNIVDEEELLKSSNISVMVRGFGRNPEGYARIEKAEKEGTYTIYLDSPAWACAEGQPVVLYIDDRVVGGGYYVVSK